MGVYYLKAAMVPNFLESIFLNLRYMTINFKNNR